MFGIQSKHVSPLEIAPPPFELISSGAAAAAAEDSSVWAEAESVEVKGEV